MYLRPNLTPRLGANICGQQIRKTKKLGADGQVNEPAHQKSIQSGPAQAKQLTLSKRGGFLWVPRLPVGPFRPQAGF
jgi:hypothetical protein